MKIVTTYEPLIGDKIEILIGKWDEAKEYVDETFGYAEIEHNSTVKAGGAVINVPQADGDVSMLWLERWSNKPEELGLIVHELLHFTFIRLNRIGVEHCKESEEIFTWYLQRMFVELMAVLTKKKK